MVTAEYLNVKHDKGAVEAAKAVMGADREHAARAATLLVQIYSNRGEFDEAGHWIERIDGLVPSFYEKYWRGIALTNLGWTREDPGLAAEDFREALEIFETSRPRRSEKPLVLQWTGVAQMGIGDYDLASKTFERLARMDPTDPTALMSWGWALYELGYSEDAADKFEQAMMVSRFKEYVYLNWANNLYQEGSDGEAIDYYKEAIRLNPEFVDAHLSLGGIYLALGNTREAAHHLRIFSKITKMEFEEVWAKVSNGDRILFEVN